MNHQDRNGNRNFRDQNPGSLRDINTRLKYQNDRRPHYNQNRPPYHQNRNHNFRNDGGYQRKYESKLVQLSNLLTSYTDVYAKLADMKDNPVREQIEKTMLEIDASVRREMSRIFGGNQRFPRESNDESQRKETNQGDEQSRQPEQSSEVH